MDFLQTMASRLREIRKEMKLNQQQMGEIMGVSRASYSLYENGKLPIDVLMLDRLRKKTGLSVSYIMGYTNKIELQFIETNPKVTAIDKELTPEESEDMLHLVFEPDEEITLEGLEKKIIEETLKKVPEFVSEAIKKELKKGKKSDETL